MRPILNKFHLDPGEAFSMWFNMRVWTFKQRVGLEILFESHQNTYNLHTYRKLEKRISKRKIDSDPKYLRESKSERTSYSLAIAMRKSLVTLG